MADQYGNLSPEDYAQQQQINRQQRMAEMLMSQNQQPQGQMVSGRYVAPSFFQNILPLVNAYQGRRLLEEGDLKQQQLAEAIRGRNSQDLEKFIDLSQGSKDFKPAVSYPTKPVISEGSDLGPQSYPPIENQVGQAPNKQAAALLALRSYDPTLRQLGGSMLSQMTKEPELVNVAPGGSLVRNVNGKVEPVFTAPKEPDHPASYKEFLLAKKEGFTGSYNDYQTMDANRKAPRIHIPSQGRAPQVLMTDNGPVLVNTYTAEATPIMLNGKPVTGNKPLPEGATTQVTGVENVKSALGDLKNRLNNFGAKDMMNPNSRALMSTDYQNVVLQLKEAMKLGVLNGNDYQILTSMITNPNDPKALLISKETQRQQIDNLSKKLDDMTANVYKTHQRPVPNNLEVTPPNTGWRIK